MNINRLKVFVAVTAAVLLTGMPVRAAEQAHVSQVSGEITWVDVNLGKLQLKNDASPNTGEILEYRITKDETRVTNPSDKKFLTIEDLQAGQHVTVDVIDGQEDKIVQKITTEPVPVSDFQIALGQLQVIDLAAGTLVLEERPMIGEEGTRHLSYFVFEPKDIVVMQSPSIQPVQLVLSPGDVLKVEYVVVNGKRHLRSITRYSPRVTSTTTTTTITTTQ